MATKSYSKHKEFKEFSTKSTIPYNSSDEQFDMIKAELLPKNSKLGSLPRNGAGADSEYYYEYKEDKHPSGKYERKDMRTVEQYTVPAKSNTEHNSYYYTREENALPAITSTHYENTSPGYSRIKSKATKELSHNVDELDSLLDDLQRDQERQLYKRSKSRERLTGLARPDTINYDELSLDLNRGYTSDTAESSSFDYRKTSTPVKTSTPSSGYSTLKTERVEQNWTSSPLAPTISRESERTREVFREEKTESHMVPSQVSPAIAQPVPPVVCHQCNYGSSTLSRSGTPMNKVTTTVKTYTYEVPADQDPTTVPIPELSEQRLEQRYLHSDTTKTTIPPSPSLGCQYCSHCNSRITGTTVTRHLSPAPAVAPPPSTTTTLREHRVETTETDSAYPNVKSERIVYPRPANDVRTPVNLDLQPNGHGPGGPASYKWSETSYSAYNTTERHPVGGTTTITNTTLHPSPAPFPRPHTPAANEQPPKKLDDLLAEFPDARFPTQPDGVSRRRVEVQQSSAAGNKKELEPKVASKNVSGPAVYYPPGHVPFQKKEGGYQLAAASQGGGAYASGRGMYEYESGSKSKEKTTERKAVVPLCLPLCCAMPCSIM